MEYHENGILSFEGKYLNGIINKEKKYNKEGKLIFGK